MVCFTTRGLSVTGWAMGRGLLPLKEGKLPTTNPRSRVGLMIRAPGFLPKDSK